MSLSATIVIMVIEYILIIVLETVDNTINYFPLPFLRKTLTVVVKITDLTTTFYERKLSAIILAH